MDRHITAGESAVGRRVDREVSEPLGGTWKTSRRWSAPNPTTFSANEGDLFRSQLDGPGVSGLLLGKISAVPESEQSGWFWTNSGSRQIVPTALYKMLTMKELDNAGLGKAAALG